MSMQTMLSRMRYNGGSQLDRINLTKLKSLRRALQADQHSRCVKTPEKEFWYGLVNDNKLTADYDRKILAIEKDAHLKSGDVIEIVDDGSKWMVYLPFLSETAYLRTEIIRCRYSVDIDGETYWVYFQGPTETSASWIIKDAVSTSLMNMKGTIYVKKDEKSEDFFRRFKMIKIGGQVWEIQATDHFSVPGIIEAVIKETFENVLQDIPNVEDADAADPVMGKGLVSQDGEYGYEVRGDYLSDDRTWQIVGNDRVEILDVSKDNRYCRVKVNDGATDSFSVRYGSGNLWYAKKVAIKDKSTPIVGPTTVAPFDNVEFSLRDSDVANGDFYFDYGDSKHARIVWQNGKSCRVEVMAARSCNFTLRFKNTDNVTYEHDVNVRSL